MTVEQIIEKIQQDTKGRKLVLSQANELVIGVNERIIEMLKAESVPNAIRLIEQKMMVLHEAIINNEGLLSHYEFNALGQVVSLLKRIE